MIILLTAAAEVRTRGVPTIHTGRGAYYPCQGPADQVQLLENQAKPPSNSCARTDRVFVQMRRGVCLDDR